VGGDVLCELDLRPGHDGVAAYAAFHDDEHGTGTHHLFVAGSPPPGTVHDLAEVTLLSGLCLFSAPSARLVTRDGAGRLVKVPIAHARTRHFTGPVTDLDLERDLTLQEREGALRLAAVSTAIAARIPREVPVTQLIDVPCAATMLNLLELTWSGHLPPELLHRWCEEVTTRHAQVTTLLSQHLTPTPTTDPPREPTTDTHAHHNRSTDAHPPTEVHRLHAPNTRAHQPHKPGGPNVRVEIRTELSPIADHLVQALSTGHVPAFDTLLALAAAQSPLWEHLIKIAQPETPADLANLSYAAAELTAAHGTQRLVVMIDNPAERKTLRQAHGYAAALAQGPSLGPLLGLYPLERVWVRDRDGHLHHNLYAHDPGHHATTPGGHPINLITLAETAYVRHTPE
ncbi:hypothetical protein HII36_55355, partial [Nonomuraea sp. NN258]|uniref:hypothetical protein n=1 Tax=Nonomuraea antri TaxID=2730852 RepID=UPI001568304C